ncbi:MAG: division/cell wall cluster transcriptional repressor MraZ [Candidatus Berkelbacteria bacterium]|nr:division/cell wall cluster transcriptional repressor MraZ [Candidatus Berkelbacteria bacterium]
MFIGQYEHAIDEKGRVAVPAKFRKFIKNEAVITKGLDGCLFLFTAEKWQKMAQSIGQLPVSKSSARLYARLILAGASDVEFDKQGRIILPTYLRKYAGIKRQVIITGLYDRIEIWDKKSWVKQISQVEGEAGEIAEDLSELGI